MTGVILAGGKNTRMGENKAFLSINGERLIDRTFRVCKSLFSEVLLVTNTPRSYLDLNLTIATDIEAGKGPLMGIYTGLLLARSPYIFVVACDMPFLNPEFIKYMMAAHRGEDIVVPRSTGGFEPLHAIYSKRLQRPIKKLLDEGRLKITDFYEGSKKRVIEENEISLFPPGDRMFFNLNRPEDLKAI